MNADLTSGIWLLNQMIKTLQKSITLEILLYALVDHFFSEHYSLRACIDSTMILASGC